MALRWAARSRQKCASETLMSLSGAYPSARTLCASAWSSLDRSGYFPSRRGEGEKTEYWRAGVSEHLNDELSPTHHSTTPLLSHPIFSVIWHPPAARDVFPAAG